MKFIQIGELGKAVAVPKYSDLPTPGIAYLDHYFVAQDTKILYTCVTEGSGYTWKVVKILPTLSNGILDGSQLLKDVEAIDASGSKVTGTFVTGEKTIGANGTYYPADDNFGAYSKVIVDVAGETAENPYVATTQSELLAYLAAEYKDSFVRYDNSAYRFESVKTLNSLGLAKYGLFDTKLGQNTINSLIDSWLGDETDKKILSFTFKGSNLPSTTVWSASITVGHSIDVYANKTLQDDGTYARMLYIVGAESTRLTSAAESTTSYEEVGDIIYVDSTKINPVFTHPEHTIVYDDQTFTFSAMSSEIDLNSSSFNIISTGWNYKEADVWTGEDGATFGTGTLSAAYYWFSGTYRTLTYALSNAQIIISKVVTGTSESSQPYREGYVYKVKLSPNKLVAYQAESPLQVGDQAAGATWHLNPNFTITDLENAIKLIAPSEVDGWFLFLNADNPYDPGVSEGDPAYFAGLWGFMVMADGNELVPNMVMYALAGDSTDETKIWLLGGENNISSFANTTITIPATWGSQIFGEALTTPATITKINHPEILNQFVGKTSTFTKTSIDQYILTVAEALGNMTEIGVDIDMTAIANNEEKPWVIPNTVVRYTGKDTDTYKQGALYILTEGN